MRYNDNSIEHTLNNVELYIDMDGTIARFHEHSNCLERMYEPGFFASLRQYENVVKAMEILHERGAKLCILSAIPCPTEAFSCVCEWAINEKRAWVEATPLGNIVSRYLFTKPGQKKSHSVSMNDGHVKVLLDDYNKNLQEWTDAGGKSIKLVNEFNDQGMVGPLWDGTRIRFDWSPDRIAEEMIAAIKKVKGNGMLLHVTSDDTNEMPYLFRRVSGNDALISNLSELSKENLEDIRAEIRSIQQVRKMGKPARGIYDPVLDAIFSVAFEPVTKNGHFKFLLLAELDDDQLDELAKVLG